MKRLAISFSVLVVLLALAGALTLVAGAVPPAESSAPAPDAQPVIVPAESATVPSGESDAVGSGESGDVDAEGPSRAASEGPIEGAPSEGSSMEPSPSASSGAVADDSKPSASLYQRVERAVKDVCAQLEARLKRLADDLVEGGSIFLNNAPLTEKQAKSIISAGSNYDSRVVYIDQHEELPSGCEIVALSVALKAEGFDASPTEIADEHLVYGSSVAHEYRGSPYVNGGGLPPCIVDACNSWLAAHGGGARAYNLTGTSFDGLLKLVEQGYPLVVWTTEGQGNPRFVGKVEDGLQWYYSEHCVVLYGVEGDQVLVSDSLEGLVKRDRERFAKIYEAIGCKAMFVLPEKDSLG